MELFERKEAIHARGAKARKGGGRVEIFVQGLHAQPAIFAAGNVVGMSGLAVFNAQRFARAVDVG